MDFDSQYVGSISEHIETRIHKLVKERGYDDERMAANHTAIRSISLQRRLSPEHQTRVEKGILRREETRIRTELYNNATLRICGNRRCMGADCLRADTSYPFRTAENNRGRTVLWLPEEVLPREARRMHMAFKVPTYIGDWYSYYDGRRGRGWAKWAWSIADELDVSGMVVLM